MKRTQKSTSGTSFHQTTFIASPSDLKMAIGQPTYECNDGSDKSNFDWSMELRDGTIFTVYDWKEYVPIHENAEIEWHIGGFSKKDTELALL